MVKVEVSKHRVCFHIQFNTRSADMHASDAIGRRLTQLSSGKYDKCFRAKMRVNIDQLKGNEVGNSHDLTHNYINCND